MLIEFVIILSNGFKKDKRKVLINLVEEITKAMDSDYDGCYSGNYGRIDAYGTYESKRSVCQGYAELTQ